MSGFVNIGAIFGGGRDVYDGVSNIVNGQPIVRDNNSIGGNAYGIFSGALGVVQELTKPGSPFNVAAGTTSPILAIANVASALDDYRGAVNAGQSDAIISSYLGFAAALGDLLATIPTPQTKGLGIALKLMATFAKDAWDAGYRPNGDNPIDAPPDAYIPVDKYDFDFWRIPGSQLSENRCISNIILSNPDPLVKDIRYVMVDPLVLDLDGDGLEITPLSQGVQFDGNGDTIRTNTSWIDADDGLLALDRNGNGVIDSGRELFGDETLLADGKKAAHGFAALAELDVGGAANATGGAGDGVFDAKDAQYTNVRVWRDLNQDGISQAGEMQTLAEAGIASIKLSSTKTDTSYGDAQLVQSGSFTRTDGSEGQAGSFIFAQNNAVTTHAPITISTEAAALPAIQGSGWVRDLQGAATLKPQLLDLFGGVQGVGSRAGFGGNISQLLLEWCNDYVTASEKALLNPWRPCRRRSRPQATASNGSLWIRPCRTVRRTTRGQRGDDLSEHLEAGAHQH